MKKVYFVGMHSKPNTEVLCGSTKTGRIINKIIAEVEFHCIKTNLSETDYLPDETELIKQMDLWMFKHNPKSKDIIILLGNWVAKHFSTNGELNTVKFRHPASLYGKEKENQYIEEVVNFINKNNTQQMKEKQKISATFAYYEITEEILKTLRDEKLYTHKWDNGRLKCLSLGSDIKKQYHLPEDRILLPFSPPKDISDREIRNFINKDEGFPETYNQYTSGYFKGAKWMRTQLAGKQPNREFIIQKMNELVNDILCKPLEGDVVNKGKLLYMPDSNKIASFINDWADKNLMEGKENDAVLFAEWLHENGWYKLHASGLWWNDNSTNGTIQKPIKALYELFKTETR